MLAAQVTAQAVHVVSCRTVCCVLQLPECVARHAPAEKHTQYSFRHLAFLQWHRLCCSSSISAHSRWCVCEAPLLVCEADCKHSWGRRRMLHAHTHSISQCAMRQRTP